jgi:hypothetical protein
MEEDKAHRLKHYLCCIDAAEAEMDTIYPNSSKRKAQYLNEKDDRYLDWKKETHANAMRSLRRQSKDFAVRNDILFKIDKVNTLVHPH